VRASAHFDYESGSRGRDSQTGPSSGQVLTIALCSAESVPSPIWTPERTRKTIEMLLERGQIERTPLVEKYLEQSRLGSGDR
jgi:hypothetical protein